MDRIVDELNTNIESAEDEGSVGVRRLVFLSEMNASTPFT
jgi:hypothetical protein